MRNPLIKRLPRELKAEFGKYLVLFVFIAGMISIISGFLVAGTSMSAAYDESFEKYNIEDGNFESFQQLDDNTLKTLEAEGTEIFENFYIEEEIKKFSKFSFSKLQFITLSFSSIAKGTKIGLRSGPVDFVGTFTLYRLKYFVPISTGVVAFNTFAINSEGIEVGEVIHL